MTDELRENVALNDRAALHKQMIEIVMGHEQEMRSASCFSERVASRKDTTALIIAAMQPALDAARSVGYREGLEAARDAVRALDFSGDGLADEPGDEQYLVAVNEALRAIRALMDAPPETKGTTDDQSSNHQ